jgi:hypothetical protein
MILPKECEGYRFGVGHAELGLKFFKPLIDSHLAQHFSMLGMVPSEVCLLYDQGYFAEPWVPTTTAEAHRSDGE